MGAEATAPLGFLRPKGIAVDPAGFVYVAEYRTCRILRFTPEGVLVGSWGRPGSKPGEMQDPSRLAAGPDGSIYVTDTANNRIQRFTPSGELLDRWGSYGTRPGQFCGPRGLEVDAEGDVLVADSNNSRLQELGPDGTLLRVWSCLGALPGLTRGPRDIAVSPDGTFVVSDSFNARVQRFALVASDDVVAPATASDAPSGWQTGPVDIVLTPTDVGTGVVRTYLRVGRNTDFAECAGPLSLTRDGVHPVQYFSVDAVGNQERVRTRTVRIDSRPPVVRPAPLALPASPAGRTVSLACSVADATSPRCRVTLIVRRGEAQIAHRSYGWQRVMRTGRRFGLTFTAPAAPGTYTLVLRARDLAGNAGQSSGALRVR